MNRVKKKTILCDDFSLMWNVFHDLFYHFYYYYDDFEYDDIDHFQVNFTLLRIPCPLLVMLLNCSFCPLAKKKNSMLKNSPKFSKSSL